MSGVGRAAGKRSARHGREARIDPVCHTLVGAALARSGLGQRTALGATALIVGANLPDLDVLAYFAGPAADLEWRRGWSHGVLALAVLPLVLTGLLLLIHFWIKRAPRASPSSMEPKQLLLLSFIAILSHPILDTLNTYGVRWLMPFSGKWFYGDSLFIVDPWVWLVLAVGIYLSRRRERSGQSDASRPIWLALAVIMLYAGVMAVSGLAAARIVASEISSLSGRVVQATMAGPVPLNPLVRQFVTEQEGEYRVGTFRWLARPQVSPTEALTFPRGRPSHPAALRAAESTLGRRFLGWARFPTFEIEQVGPAQYLVHVVDLRYARRAGDRFGAISIPVTLEGKRERGKEGKQEGVRSEPLP
jgi:inner membrane protein